MEPRAVRTWRSSRTSTRSRSTARSPGSIRAQLPAAPPDAPEPFDTVLRDLETVILPGLSHWQHPRFFGYFPSNGELASVLAHELGHFRLKHIRKRILLGMATSLAGLWLLGLLARQPWFYQGLGVGAPVDFEALALLLFFLALPVFTFPLQPLFSMLSRRHEFEADAFAKKLTNSPEDLVTALKKLSRRNLANLTPHPFQVFINYSHPPVLKRIEVLRG